MERVATGADDGGMDRPVVLLVDDDPSMRDLLASMFTLHGGFRIGGVAEDGLEGAMMAADLHPDVVVLDYYMPRWDGEKAAHFIRANSPESRIIAFSAVLGEPPDWADDFCVKNEIMRLVPLVEALVHAA